MYQIPQSRKNDHQHTSFSKLIVLHRRHHTSLKYRQFATHLNQKIRVYLTASSITHRWFWWSSKARAALPASVTLTQSPTASDTLNRREWRGTLLRLAAWEHRAWFWGWLDGVKAIVLAVSLFDCHSIASEPLSTFDFVESSSALVFRNECVDSPQLRRDT